MRCMCVRVCARTCVSVCVCVCTEKGCVSAKERQKPSMTQTEKNLRERNEKINLDFSYPSLISRFPVTVIGTILEQLLGK